MNGRHFRAHQRFQVALPVLARLLGRPATVRGTMVDVGLGGGACALDEPLRLGEEVVLAVAAEPPVELRASVAWVAWGESTAARIGFQFADSDLDRVMALLERVVAREDVGT
jgi:hypothetical protein